MNDNDLTTKYSIISFLVIIVIGISFFGGYSLGTHNTYKEFSVPTLKNTEAKNISPNAIDFAPFWKAWNVLDEKFIATSSSTQNISDQDRVWGAIKGMTASLGDPHTVFFPPEDAKAFSEEISGSFSGIGAELSAKDGSIVVVSPLKNSPAEKAGLLPEDIIVSIDGKSAQGLSVESAITKIRGERGTTVVLSVARKESEIIDIKIIRDNIEVPVIKTEHKTKDGVFVISLYSFSENSATKFKEALMEFAKSKERNLIIDLRGNPGGYLEAAVDMASWFLPEGEVVLREDFGNGKEEIYRSRGYNLFKKDIYKTVILINEGSASASEILAGALSEHGVAKLVGSKSFGKGSVQELVDITRDTSLKVTIARWLTPNGLSISDGGLTPDYIVDFSDEDIKNKKDVQMEKAVEILKK